MSLISRNFKAFQVLRRVYCPAIHVTRSIGDVNKSNDVNIFDVFQTKKLQKERAAKREDAETYDYVKEEIGYRLSDRLFDIKKEFENAVDLGGGRGFLSRHILAETVKNLKVYDISPSMLEQAYGTPGVNIEKHLLTNEILDLPENSQDLVISNLALHWFNDLPGIFKSINNFLKPDGAFLASLFGGETLYELRSSLQLAEQERIGGLASHISPFTKIRDVGALLNRAGFTMLTIDTDEMVIGYPSMFELLHDIKAMGESNATFNRPLTISRDVLLAASTIYQEMYPKKNPETNENGIHATYQVIYFIAWKKHESQPQPLERGTANVSFKDLEKIISNKKDDTLNLNKTN